MRFFLISIFLITVFGCKVATVENFTQSEVVEEDLIRNPYFSDPKVDYVYKADINVYGNEFSGILILKNISPEKHRMVFTSQFGSTFFDIEFENESYKINTIIEQLDRKIILNTLIRDFSLLVKEKEVVAGKYYNDEYNVFENQKDKRFNYYFYHKNDQRLDKIVHTSKRKEKFVIQFEQVSEDQIAKKVRIDHKNIKLKIELSFLKK